MPKRQPYAGLPERNRKELVRLIGFINGIQRKEIEELKKRVQMLEETVQTLQRTPSVQGRTFQLYDDESD